MRDRIQAVGAAVVVSLIVAGASLALAVATALAPGAAAAPDPRCAVAAAATADARPTRALDYLDARAPRLAAPTPPAACLAERDAALSAIDRAADLADSAYVWQPGGVAPYSGADESWDESLDRATQALALDADAVSALAGRSAADLRTQALAHLPVHAAADSAHGWWQTLADGARPLGAPALAFVCALAAVLLAARLLAPVTLHWPVLREPERLAVGAAGVVAAIAGTLVLGLGVTMATSGVRAPDSWTGPTQALRWALCATGVTAAAVAVTNAVRRRTPHSLNRRRRTPAWSASAGALGLVVAGLTIARAPALWLGLTACALAVLLVATLLATRLRLVVEVRRDGDGERPDGDPATGATRLVALLGDLAGRPSAGTHVPRGADVDRLGGAALAELPANVALKAVATAAQWLSGTAPWQVRVEEGGDGALSVVVTRNGRTATSATYERSALVGFGIAQHLADQADLMRAAAATVVTTLAEHHTGFEGLCGASDARSLARYYIATTDLSGDADARRTLLAHATEADPENWLAQVALGNAVGERAAQARELEAYLAWIDQVLDQLALRSSAPLRPRSAATAGGRAPRGFEGLRLRLLYNRAATAINLAFARGTDGTVIDQSVVASVVTLWQALAQQARRHGAGRRRNAHLVAELADASLGMVLRARHALASVPAGTDQAATLTSLTQSWAAVTGRDTLPTDDEPARTPTGAYNLACWAATTPGVDIAVAVRHLRQSFALADNRDWLEQDPVMAAVVRSGAFRQVLAVPPLPDVLAMAPLADHAGRLRALGLESAERIARLAWQDLVGYLAVTPLEAKVMVEAARLATTLPDSPARYDLALTLLRVGHHGRPDAASGETVARLTATVRRLDLTAEQAQATLDGLRSAGWPVSGPPARGAAA
ncbi:hypothetical protein [Xylanimonas ulmi]|uniref:Uncharacterized protein n=1 Tax=Xylanimonas ulmi TaxID=228973 RepID=A0A4Q7M4L3_9MICO|nr:hypothetical protein [Xylanibacterium ulmi]RZS61867.1 hypothetical protein EV386_2179 [Xylanibacterium ulmi]